MPVRGRTQLAEHCEGETLHPAREQRVGWDRLASHHVPEARLRTADIDHDLAHVVPVDRELAVDRVPARGCIEVLLHALRRDDRSPASKKPMPHQRSAQALRVAVDPGLHHPQLRVDLFDGHALGHAEVDERDAPVVQQQVVPRVRIGGKAPRAIQRPEEEAVHDLTEPVALGVGQLLDVVEPHPVHVFGDQYALAGKLRHDLRDHDKRMPAPSARERAVRLRLDLVVQLLREPLTNLLCHRLRVHAGRERLRQSQQQTQVLQSARTALAMPGYCTLTATRRPSCSRAR